MVRLLAGISGPRRPEVMPWPWELSIWPVNTICWGAVTKRYDGRLGDGTFGNVSFWRQEWLTALGRSNYVEDCWKRLRLVAQRQSSGLIIHSPDKPKRQQNKPLAETGKTDLASYLAQIAEKDPDLAEVVAVWSELPEHIKAAIKTLVEAHKGKA